jgi:predicted DNA-binding transcriptional regulator YafY
VRIHSTAEEASTHIMPTDGVIKACPDQPDKCIVTIGGDPEWIAQYLIGLAVRFEVIDPPSVRNELRAIARRVLKEHPAG